MDTCRIIQLPIFTERVRKLLTDLEYWELQDSLAEHPYSGKLIPNGKGLRKLRWAIAREARGKRGGVRVIYYWVRNPATIYFVSIYAKNEQENLTPKQLKALAAIAERELK